MRCSQSATREYPFFGDHLVLFQPHTRQLMLLNPTAGFIWRSHQAGDSDIRIAESMAEATGASPADLLADVEASLSAWREQALLDGDCIPQPAEPSRQDHSVPVVWPAATAWKYIQQLQLCGRHICLRTTSSDIHQALLPILAHLAEHHEGGWEHCLSIWQTADGHTHIAVDEQLSDSLQHEDAVISRILYELVELCYRRDENLAVLHASAVAIDTGALILAGAGGSGKTTLAASLQSRGFTYLSDDVSPVTTKSHRVRPVAMSQAIKAGSWPVLETLRPELHAQHSYQRFSHSVRFLPPITGCPGDWNRSWPIKGLLFPLYQPHSSGVCRALNPLESLQKLLQSNSIYSDNVADLLRLLEQTPAFELHYADLEQAHTGIQKIITMID